MSIRGLRFGPLRAAVHACIDMQVYFAEGSDWAAPGTAAIAPACARLAAHAPARTIFTRFMPPHSGEHAQGHWQVYYRRWESVLGHRNDPAIYDILPALKPFTPPGIVVDKPTHSAFEAPAFAAALEALGAEAVIFSGVETDVCVLATVLTAIDKGFRVILAEDALASSSAEGHAAAMQAVYPRYDQQIEVLTVDEIVRMWTP